MADLGVDTVVKFTAALRDEVKKRAITIPRELENIIVDKMFELYLQGEIVDANIRYVEGGLTVILDRSA
ncbi:MAG: hypothetical protein MZU97_13640 [Bacillus subtilis]|nr:hypothetical protein [Bacillus subtilis]